MGEARNVLWRNRIVEHRDVNPLELTPNPQNWRRHSRSQKDALSSVLGEVGTVASVMVNKTTGRVIDGHARLELAIATHQPTVPVDFVELSEREEAIILATFDPIAAMADTDSRQFDRLLSGLKEDTDSAVADLLLELQRDFGSSPRSGTQPTDDLPPVDPAAIITTKAHDLWLLGNHRMLCGDATSADDVARVCAGGVVPLVMLTDPPYCSGGFQEAGRAQGSIGTKRKGSGGKEYTPEIMNDKLSTRGYVALMKQAVRNSPTAMLYCFTDWRMWINLYDVAESSGYGVRNMIVWNKGTPGMGQGWRSQHEIVMFGAKATVRFDGRKAVGNVIDCQRTGNPLHPTQKPVELLCKILEVTAMAERVYDPFAGSGSTLMAAEHMGRAACLIELSPMYCDVTVRRWQEHTGLAATLESTGQTFAAVSQERKAA